MMKFNLEIPKRCFDCPCCIITIFEGKNICCMGGKSCTPLTKEELFQLGRLSDCPIIIDKEEK